MVIQAGESRVEGAAAVVAVRPAAKGRLPLQALFDAMGDPVVGHDVSGRRSYTNAAYDALVGVDRGSLVGLTNPFPDWPRETTATYVDLARAALLGRDRGTSPVISASATVRHSSGDLARVTMTVDVLTDGDARPVAVVSVVRPAERLPWMERRRRSETPDRVRQLEDGLRTIALELQRLGVPAVALDQGRDPEDLACLQTLSSREWEVLKALLDGARVASIARRLHLSQHTVRNHLKSIFKKVGVSSQAELIERLRPRAA